MYFYLHDDDDDVMCGGQCDVIDDESLKNVCQNLEIGYDDGAFREDVNYLS